MTINTLQNKVVILIFNFYKISLCIKEYRDAAFSEKSKILFYSCCMYLSP